MSKHTYKYTYSRRTYTLMLLHQNNLGTVNKRDDLFLQLKIVAMQPDHFIHAKWTMFSPTSSASMIFRCYGRLFNAAVAFPLQFAYYWLSSSYGREKHTQSHTPYTSYKRTKDRQNTCAFLSSICLQIWSCFMSEYTTSGIRQIEIITIIDVENISCEIIRTVGCIYSISAI